MTRHPRTCLSVALLLTASMAVATEIFTWVDEEGVTHFSEKPPSAGAPDVQLIEVRPDDSPGDRQAGDDDFYSVVKQAERMTARRLENEKLAAEKRQANAEASRARAQTEVINQDTGNYNATNNARYYPAYPYYPRYPRYPRYPGWPGHGHKPVYPVHPVYPGRGRITTPRTSLGKTPGMPR